MRDPDPKPAGTWDYRGSCAPERRPDGTFTAVSGGIFTLGCFQWVPRARGEGTKVGKIVYRVRGDALDPAPAFDAAEAFCARKNAEQA